MGASSTGLSALDIYVQIDDGGTDNGGTANSRSAPTITGIDLTTGVFAGNNTGNIIGELYAADPVDNPPPISPDGLLAAESVETALTGPHTLAPFSTSVLGTLTLNATGLAGDTFDIYFTNVADNYNGAPFYGESDSDYGYGNNSITFGSSDSGSSDYLGTSTPLTEPLVVNIVAVPEPATLSGMMIFSTGLLLRRRSRNRD
jgi:hypothetical protein